MLKIRKEKEVAFIAETRKKFTEACDVRLGGDKE